MILQPLAGAVLTLDQAHVVDPASQRVVSTDPRDESLVVADRGVWRSRSATDTLLSRAFDSAALAKGFDSRLIRISYPANSCSPGDTYKGDTGGTAGLAGTARPAGGMSFVYPARACEHVIMRYGVKFPVGFDWRWGGKLPGPSTADVSASGGNTDPTVAGVSSLTARLMWRPDGLVTPYFYMGDNRDARWVGSGYSNPSIPSATWQDAYYSGSTLFASPAYFTPGQIDVVEIELAMNTPGVSNGYARISLNGTNFVERSDIKWRNASGGTLKWDRAFMSSFFGGSTAATSDAQLWFTGVTTAVDLTDVLWIPQD